MPPIYGGLPLTGRNALRTVTGADTAITRLDDTDGSTKFRDLVAATKCLGASLLTLVAGHQSASGTLALRLAFYDQDDELVGISDAIALDATALQASLLSAAGVANTRYLSVVQLEAPIAAAAFRPYVTAMATSTAVDIFVDTYDEVLP